MKTAKCILIGLTLIYGYSCSNDNTAHEDNTEHQHTEHEGHDTDPAHDHEGEDHDHDSESHAAADDEIILKPEQAEKLGVKVDTVRLQTVNEVVRVTGEVIPDPANQGLIVAPVSGRLTFATTVKEGTNINKGQKIATISGTEFAGGDANRLANIELEAAKKELDRLTPLREEGIVTAAEYNAALQAYNRARSAIGSSGGTATAPISGVITAVEVANGQYVDAGQPIARLAANGRLTVRADVPKRYAATARTARTATVRLPYSGTTLDATLAAQPSEAASTSAYLPIYYNVSSSSELSPGSYVEVFLNVGTSRPGIKVPLSSITERLGTKFVYVKIDDEGYERRPVTVGAIDGKYAEITSGLTAGEPIVTDGTTFVRLAETSNVAPQGHTHNH